MRWLELRPGTKLTSNLKDQLSLVVVKHQSWMVAHSLLSVEEFLLGLIRLLLFEVDLTEPHFGPNDTVEVWVLGSEVSRFSRFAPRTSKARTAHCPLLL